jgi:hypothetical protein
MRFGPGLRIAAVAALAVLGLIGLVARESWERDRGTELVLPMSSVDPRSVLSGNFVAITLQEPLALGQGCPPGFDASEIYNGPPPMVWIAFRQAGDHAVAVGAASTREAAARLSPIVTRGQATCIPPPTEPDGSPPQPGSVLLNLGVDRFYASQAEAKAIGDNTTGCDPGAGCPAAAILSIGQDTRARIKGLIVNGKRYQMAAF